MEVEDPGQTVFEVGGIHLLLPAHVEEDRQAGFLEEGPERVEAHMGRAVTGRTARGDHQAPTAEVDSLPGDPGRRLDVQEGDIARRQQPAVD